MTETGAYLLLGVAAVIGGILIWVGIKTKSFTKILGGIATVLGGLFGWQTKRVSQKSAEVKAKDAQIKDAEKQMEEIHEVQQEIKGAEAAVEKPEPVPPADAGDSTARLDRLNRL